MRLIDLIHHLGPNHTPLPSTELSQATVRGITEDSRKVQPGWLFVAKAGVKTDGSRFLADAASRGALAAVVQTPDPQVPICQIGYPDPSMAASVLAHAYYGQPTRKMSVFGVTGTNGKTTTAFVVRHLLSGLSRKCGLLGTVEIDDGASRVESDMTTPSAVDLAEIFAQMAANGCVSATMEVSSHALHQNRAGAVHFAAAAFTNLTGDHLDYHGTMENYAAAKAKLFEMLDESAVAVVSGYSPYTPRMIRDCKARIVRFGYDATCDYVASDVQISASGTSFELSGPRGKAKVKMPLIGKHNIENVLAAVGMVGEVLRISTAELASLLSDCTGAPGRLQPVRVGQPYAVLVDYAHTDDALENVLNALKPLTTGKLRVVFGCGGDRDKTKRPRMAKVATKYADAIYVTSDNPRTEDPIAILADIRAGFTPQDSSKIAMVESDRRSAIKKAVHDCHAGDVLLIAGKGHENYQIIGTTKHHFDDVEEASEAVRQTMGKSNGKAA